MRNVALEIAYDGTGYSGWQVQDNAVTVQGTIEEALAGITGRPSRLRVAGRTDAGVHALGQVASFFSESGMGGGEFQRAINSLVPSDVRVLRAFDVPPDFHPRFSAKRRWYRYLVSNTGTPVPFFRHYAMWLPREVDVDLLNAYSRRIVGARDFTSLATLERGEDPVRDVLSCGFERRGDFIAFDIKANGFLRKMVRTIVGTFLEMEKRREPAEAVDEMLAARDRGRAGSTAFPGGLYLMKVFY